MCTVLFSKCLSLQIQVRKEVCNYDAACICGVIVREINSAVKVGYNVCGQWDTIEPRPISVTLLLTQYPDDGTEINRDETGRIFSVSGLDSLHNLNLNYSYQVRFC